MMRRMMSVSVLKEELTAAFKVSVVNGIKKCSECGCVLNLASVSYDYIQDRISQWNVLVFPATYVFSEYTHAIPFTIFVDLSIDSSFTGVRFSDNV